MLLAALAACLASGLSAEVQLSGQIHRKCHTLQGSIDCGMHAPICAPLDPIFTWAFLCFVLQPSLPQLASRRLSTQTRRKPLHSSTTLRSDAVTRLALQSDVPADTRLAIPSLGLAAGAVVRPGSGRRNKVLHCPIPA